MKDKELSAEEIVKRMRRKIDKTRREREARNCVIFKAVLKEGAEIKPLESCGCTGRECGLFNDCTMPDVDAIIPKRFKFKD